MKASTNDGPRTQSQFPAFRSIKLGAVDARNLAAKPVEAIRPTGSAINSRGGINVAGRGGFGVRGRGGGPNMRGGPSMRGGAGARGSERGIGRTGRGGRGRGEKRRRRGGEGGWQGDGGDTREEATLAELEYMKELEEQKAVKPVAFVVPEVSQEALSGMGPALAFGEFGMSETVRQRLNTVEARQQWGFEKELGGESGVMDKQNEVEAEQIQEDQRSELVNKMLRGDYVMGRDGGHGDVVGQVMKSTCRNESYYPEDGASLMAKVMTILPVQTRGTAQARQSARV